MIRTAAEWVAFSAPTLGAIPKPSYKMTLCSRVPGRERWLVPAMMKKPRWAAAVEMVLRGEDGVKSACANPVTGRVLVEFSPSRITAPVEVLIQQALAFGPMSKSEFAARSAKPDLMVSSTHLAATELLCFVVRMSLFGGGCVAAGAAAAAFCLHRWWTKHS